MFALSMELQNKDEAEAIDCSEQILPMQHKDSLMQRFGNASVIIQDSIASKELHEDH